MSLRTYSQALPWKAFVPDLVTRLLMEPALLPYCADWFKVKLPDQTEGWVAAGWIVTASQAPQ